MSTGVPQPRKKQIVIRPASEVDVPAIAHLGSTTFASTFGYSMPNTDLQAYLSETYNHDAVQSDLSNPLVTIFIASDSSQPSSVMGFVQMNEGKVEDCVKGAKPMKLQRLYVDETYHGSGVGGALFRFVENWAKEKGFETLWLGVWEENLKAQKVYERFGFSKVGAQDFIMGTCVQTDWILIKNLHG